MLGTVLDAWDASVNKTDKGTGFNNMVRQKPEKVMQLANWISRKKVFQVKKKKKKGSKKEGGAGVE